MKELLRLIEDQLYLEHGTLNESSSARTVEGWDSLATIRICMAVEECYSKKFTMDQIASSFDSVAAIWDLLQKGRPAPVLT